MNVKERNRAIKKALSKEFGAKNVSVRGDRGTAYGWVDVTIKVGGLKSEYWSQTDTIKRTEIRNKIEEIEKRAYNAIEKAGLWDSLYTWYDDMGYKNKEILIEVD